MCSISNAPNQSTYELLIGKESLGVTVVLVLVLVICLLKRLLQLGIVLACQILGILRLKGGLFLIELFLHTMGESQVAERVFDDCAILL